ncbi:hypothetical protein [Streptomyces radicis]|uniref:Ig-like domain-containing protein n=1 Tax=Streptomyces radicis TaxID=1750517 RepID=A0A3A9W2W1_9ACTN|nr:hypothetical protein [Streptomyces radicis]RKN07179.1 hypothetical protein D7319_18990 [Streptomyces radicis]RKN26802.1 hypothetical protein D7318_05560 [Streptomyces radicis]
MKRARILALTATAILVAGTATAAAQGGGSGPAPDVKSTPGVAEVAPSAAHNQYWSTPVTITPGSSALASVTCPTGQVPTGGGAGTSSFDIYLLDTRPSGNSWIAYGKNTGTFDQSLTAYVICTVP